MLSLDAPVIAVLWQAFVAQCFPSALRPAGRVVLGLTVWSIYLADRLFDVRRPAVGEESARHDFYRRHSRITIAILTIAASADCLITFVWLRPAVLHTGIIVSAGVLLYLFVLHFGGTHLRIPKELVVAVLFSAGTFVVAWTSPSANHHELLGAGASFALLCLANLVAIESWEFRELRRDLGARPHVLTRWLETAYLAWVPALAVVCAAFGSRWYIAVAMSAAALAGIFAVGPRWSLEVRRVLVDAALLTPLLFLL